AQGVPEDAAYIKVTTDGIVDTYFARVVGQDSLPVNTESHSGFCLPTDEVYPIAIYDKYIKDGFFTDPGDGTYNANGFVSQEYPTGYPTREFKLETQNPGNFTNGFAWLRWTPNQQNAANMLRGFGNLKDGFEEAAWPKGSSSPAPDFYPLTPGQISVNDWVYGFPGNPYDGNVQALLQGHVDNRTLMLLPIVSDSVVVNGSQFAYQFNRLGIFFLVGYGNDTIELAYVGEANNETCLRTPPDTPTPGLEGNVLVKPRWSDSSETRPINYQILLDTSGSMSWDFDGYGTRGGTNYMCESPNNPNPKGLSYIDTCTNGSDSGWATTEERRIYIAKQAINQLIDEMDEYDVMQVIAFSRNSSNGSNNAKAYPVDGLTGDKGKLKEAVQQAGMWRTSEPYNTTGGTSGAQAMRLTGQLLEQAPDKAPDGREYRDVVIYLTDGVANVFMDGNQNDARDICGHMPANQARNTPDPCQLDSTNGGELRPITALIAEATNIRQNNPGMDLFVVAMAHFDSTGLNQVASSPETVYKANQAGVVDDIFRAINDQVEGGQCTAYDSDPTSDIAGHEVGSLDGYPVPQGGHGYVTIRDAAGDVLPNGKGRLPIVYDPATGGLVYSIPPEDGITPGDYSISAYVNYRGPDGVARTYEWIVSATDPDGTRSQSFNIPKENFSGSHQVDTLLLDLNPDATLCGANSF
ncbi:MAG: vWA domain-containing protein, partial [Chloroflexota bacterium]